MKKLLLTTLVLLMNVNVAMADVIGVYTDATASNCTLPAGFTTTATVVHKFATGATGSRFKVSLPAGSSFFAFNTPYVPIGVLVYDLSLGYGLCLSGSFALGQIVAVLAPGLIDVLPADGFPSIIYTDCLFAEWPAFGRYACVGGVHNCCEDFAVETSTWGKVKSLYR